MSPVRKQCGANLAAIRRENAARAYDCANLYVNTPRFAVFHAQVCHWLAAADAAESGDLSPRPFGGAQ